MWWVEARDAAEDPTVRRMAPRPGLQQPRTLVVMRLRSPVTEVYGLWRKIPMCYHA